MVSHSHTAAHSPLREEAASTRSICPDDTYTTRDVLRGG